MNSLKINCSQETKQDLNSMFSQNEETNKLRRKLETFNALVTERDELRETCEKIELWKEEFENGHKKVFSELKSTCSLQLEILKKNMAVENELDLKLKELQNVNDCINNQKKTLKFNENKLRSKLEDSKQVIEKLMEELCSVKSELDEKNRTTEQLKTNLKSNENELCDVRRQLEFRIKECDGLNNMNAMLDMDFKCIKSKLDDAKECLENLTLERETLSSELSIKCREVNELELQYDRAKNEINSEKCKVDGLTEKLAKVYKEKGYEQTEIKNQMVLLKKDNCSKEEELRKLTKKYEKLLQETNKEQLTSCADPTTESIMFKKYTPSENMSTTVNGTAELNNLNYELENLKKDLGIDFKTQQL